jgi:hypothetical protein
MSRTASRQVTWQFAEPIRRNVFRLLTVFLISLALFSQVNVADDLPETSGDQKPLWELSLLPLGFLKKQLWSRVHLGFANSDSLVVTWTVPAKRIPPTSQEPQPTRGATLIVVRLDAHTGKQLSKNELPIPASSRFKTYVTGQGNLLVRSGQDIRLFSPEFHSLRDKEFPTPTKPGWFGDMKISPSGKSLLVCPANGDASPAQVLDAETFDVLDTFPIQVHRPCSYYGAGDRSVVSPGLKQIGLYIRDFGGAWRTLQSNEDSNMPGSEKLRAATFLNEGTSLVEFNDRFSVITVQGALLYTKSLPKGVQWGRPAITSAGGDYYALVKDRIRGLTVPTLDMYAYATPDELLVFSTEKGEEVFRVKVEGVSPWFHKDLYQQYALSADGSLIAVLTNGMLRVFRAR